ncbi:hypothetical protein MNBD_GAMMA12-1058 [hydrothermal vent metagenome]|uniref:Uncharacterized protein n=1 Tax=hydrothermal vent metagenome TaxID=652676 RepID=A0A3B0YMW5_9ZZZZ
MERIEKKIQKKLKFEVGTVLQEELRDESTHRLSVTINSTSHTVNKKTTQKIWIENEEGDENVRMTVDVRPG